MSEARGADQLLRQRVRDDPGLGTWVNEIDNDQARRVLDGEDPFDEEAFSEGEDRRHERAHEEGHVGLHLQPRPLRTRSALVPLQPPQHHGVACTVDRNRQVRRRGQGGVRGVESRLKLPAARAWSDSTCCSSSRTRLTPSRPMPSPPSGIPPQLLDVAPE